MFFYWGENYKDDIEDLRAKFGFSQLDVAIYLGRTYGDRADRIVRLMQKGFSNRLGLDFPFVEGEVVYAVRNEGTLSIDDILSRRTFLSLSTAKNCVEKIGKLLAVELQWTQEMLIKECKETYKLLKNISL